MDIEYIHEFVTLSTVGNYQKAADQLFISQSALSRHIQSLESSLGVPLFKRTTRSIALTEYGKIFYPYACTIVKTQYEYTTELYNRMQNNKGTITIGALPVLSPYHIPEILAKFQNENKNFHLIVTPSDNLDQLYNQTVDFIFIRDMGQDLKDIVKIPFTTDSLAAILPLDHPLAHASSLRLEQLKDEKFLLLPKGCSMYNRCITECQQAGFEPQVSYTGPQAETILALVQNHIGVGLLTKKPLSLLQHNCAIVDITPTISTPICLAYLKSAKHSIGARHFIECVESFILDDNANSI